MGAQPHLKSRACVLLVLLACLGGLAACGETSDQHAARQTVSRFFQALKDRDPGAACGVLTPGLAAAMLRASGEPGKACLAGFRAIFRRIDASAEPNAFKAIPKVGVAAIHGDSASVVISQGYQRRHVGLTRVQGGWKISQSAGLGQR